MLAGRGYAVAELDGGELDTGPTTVGAVLVGLSYWTETWSETRRGSWDAFADLLTTLDETVNAPGYFVIVRHAERMWRRSHTSFVAGASLIDCWLRAAQFWRGVKPFRLIFVYGDEGADVPL